MADAGSIDKRADRMIQSMGFAPGDEKLPVSAFSGGWKMRIGLGKALLREPQVCVCVSMYIYKYIGVCLCIYIYIYIYT